MTKLGPKASKGFKQPSAPRKSAGGVYNAKILYRNVNKLYLREDISNIVPKSRQAVTKLAITGSPVAPIMNTIGVSIASYNTVRVTGQAGAVGTELRDRQTIRMTTQIGPSRPNLHLHDKP